MESKQSLSEFQQAANYVLLVGEGDFSFASSFIQRTRYHVIATCLLTSEKLTERQYYNIELIKKLGGEVYTDVDATHLAANSKIQVHRFSIIIFNFPHVSGKMNIRKNRTLLERFFLSAKDVLAEKGEIWVTLCKGQGGIPVDECQREWNNTWQITVLAGTSNLILHQVRHFNAECYPAYKCSGHRGLEKSFNMKGALTYIFVQGQAFREISAFNEKSLICHSRKLFKKGEFHVSELTYYAEKLKKKFSNEHPIIKVISFVMEEAKKKIDKLHIISFPEPTFVSDENELGYSNSQVFQVKGNMLSDPLSYLNIDNIIDICKKQLNDGIQAVVVNGTISICFQVSLAKLPVYHEVTFFSKNEGGIINTVQCILSSVLLLQADTSWNVDNSFEHSMNDDIDIIQLSAENDSSPNFPQILQSNTITQNSKISYCGIPSMENIRMSRKLYSIYVTYDIVYSESHALYQNFKFTLSQKNIQATNCVLEIGNVYSVSKLICIVLNIDHICMLKYHVHDWRILWSSLAYYSTDLYESKLYELYRSPSLFPSVFTHDTSFWISDNFDENILLLLVRESVGDLVSYIVLLDSYYDRYTQRNSRCYRFVYQSCDQPLSKDLTRDIHTRVIREILQQTLDISLR